MKTVVVQYICVTLSMQRIEEVEEESQSSSSANLSSIPKTEVRTTPSTNENPSGELAYSYWLELLRKPMRIRLANLLIPIG